MTCQPPHLTPSTRRAAIAARQGVATPDVTALSEPGIDRPRTSEARIARRNHAAPPIPFKDGCNTAPVASAPWAPSAEPAEPTSLSTRPDQALAQVGRCDTPVVKRLPPRRVPPLAQSNQTEGVDTATRRDPHGGTPIAGGQGAAPKLTRFGIPPIATPRHSAHCHSRAARAAFLASAGRTPMRMPPTPTAPYARRASQDRNRPAPSS
ncbi:MAG: hypothetical protein AAFR47_20300 [Pseudomonadota bacterium]